MLIFLTMLLLGGILGFIGVGGAGIMIAVLTVIFGIPVHTALGTSLGAMVFTTFSGVYSHCREGNVAWRIGSIVGIFGASGAFFGARLSAYIPSDRLAVFTGIVMLFFCALIYVRIFHQKSRLFQLRIFQTRPSGLKFWLLAAGTGLFNGLVAGTFGVGSAPLIQLTLLVIFNISLYQTVGTTMLVIFPIGLLGGLGFLTAGYLDAGLFTQVVLGQIIGAYIGAKFTRLAPVILLKITMLLVPAVGGLSMIIFNLFRC
ncbi:MAG: sulfite exporter TauE/SafE family protein [Desulfovibrionaceae bacterium]